MRLSGPELQVRVEQLSALQSPCVLCPRACGAERVSGSIGYCQAPYDVMVSSYGPHHGEERELVGDGGSGTIFFTHCSLRCSFCQNYEISHLGRGRVVEVAELASMMLELQAVGCRNVNLVTPTHYAPQIAAALAEAVSAGLTVPVVYNCGGYESVATLKHLEGVVDIYMPDAKFAEAAPAGTLCDAPDYPERMLEALVEMHRQVGDLRVGSDGVAVEGLLIRHLVMPGDAAGSARVFELIASRVSKSAAVNVMGQYRPYGGLTRSQGVLGAPLDPEEHRAAVEAALASGLRVLA